MPFRTFWRGSGDKNKLLPHFSAKAAANLAWSGCVTSHQPVSVSSRSIGALPSKYSFGFGHARRFVPAVQKIPFQKRDDEKETETQHGGSEHQSEEIGRLRLRRRVLDGIAETTYAHLSRTGVKLSDESA